MACESSKLLPAPRDKLRIFTSHARNCAKVQVVFERPVFKPLPKIAVLRDPRENFPRSPGSPAKPPNPSHSLALKLLGPHIRDGAIELLLFLLQGRVPPAQLALQRPAADTLRTTFQVAVTLVLAAVAMDRPLRVEDVETLLRRPNAPCRPIRAC